MSGSATRQVFSVEELKLAWQAVRDGQFRHDSPAPAGNRAAADSPAARTWEPGPAEQVMVVLGCEGACGASTLAVAAAASTNVATRVIEGCSAASSGLAEACTAELGVVGRWRRGTREQVVIERVAEALTHPGQTPLPAEPDRHVQLTVVDPGWPAATVLSTDGWMSDLVLSGAPVVLVARATVPGLRRLETALHLVPGTVQAAVLGPRVKKWAQPVRHSLGPRVRSLLEAGRLAVVPVDRHLAATGLNPETQIPAGVLKAAQVVTRNAVDASTHEGETA